MKKVAPKVVVAVFAHPDDEAFGPGGTLAHFAKSGIDVHIVCVTDGGAGKSSNPEDLSHLGDVRKQEFLNATKTLGVKSVSLLGFPDGSLNNNMYQTVVGAIKKELDRLHPDTLVTFDTNGVSGHLDHVAVAMMTSYIFERVTYANTLMYYCQKKSVAEAMRGKYFVYFPPGYSDDQIDLTVDVTDVLDTKIRAMRAHISQSEDCERIIGSMGDRLKVENFRILSK